MGEEKEKYQIELKNIEDKYSKTKTEREYLEKELADAEREKASIDRTWTEKLATQAEGGKRQIEAEIEEKVQVYKCTIQEIQQNASEKNQIIDNLNASNEELKKEKKEMMQHL